MEKTMPRKAEAAPTKTSNAEFGRRIQSLMLERNWNQAELSRAAGLGRDSVSTYIRGKVFPDPKNLKLIADAFGMTPQQLMPSDMTSVMDAEVPALEIRQSAADPSKVHIRINRTVTVEQAGKIFAILNHA